MNGPQERLEDKCPGCQHWGKGHRIDIITKKEVCTVKLIDASELQKKSEDIQKDAEGRTASWRVCATSYSPRQKPSIIARLFGKRPQKRYCPICGKRIRSEAAGAFCSVNCAVKFMDKEEQDGAFQDRG